LLEKREARGYTGSEPRSKSERTLRVDSGIVDGDVRGRQSTESVRKRGRGNCADEATRRLERRLPRGEYQKTLPARHVLRISTHAIATVGQVK